MDLEAKYRLWKARKIFADSRENFYEGLAQALKDNQSLGRYLEKKRDRAIARKRPIAPLFATWVERYRDRGHFFEAVHGDVPQIDYMVMSIAEDAGTLAEGLEFLAKTSRELRQVKKAVKAAIAGPALPGVLVLILLFAYSFFMVPMLTEIAPPDEWPLFGRILHGLANSIQSYGIIWVVAIGGLVGGCIYSLPRAGRYRFMLDRLPVYSAYREYNGAMFLVTLGSLVQAGFSFGKAVERLHSSASPWLKHYITRMLRRMSVEKDVVKSLDVSLIPEETMDDLLDFSESSSPQAAIERFGLEGIARIRERMESISASAKTGGILVIGITLGTIILGTLTTVWSISVGMDGLN